MCSVFALGVIGVGLQVAGAIQGRRAASAQAKAVGLETEAAQKEAEAQAEQYESRAEATEYNRQVTEENRKIALWAAEDIRYQGRVAASRKAREIRQIKGSQIAHMASSGFLVAGGTGYKILRDTERLGREDMDYILAQTERAAYERELEAFSLGAEGELQRRAAEGDRLAAQRTRESKRAIAGIGAARASAVRRGGNAALFGGFARAVPGAISTYEAGKEAGFFGGRQVSWSGAR